MTYRFDDYLSDQEAGAVQLMPIEEFCQSVDVGAYTDYDGHGVLVDMHDKHIPQLMETVFGAFHQVNYTHVAWFNK